MKITRNTKYKDVVFLFKRIDVLQKGLAAITEQDMASFNYPSFLDMTIGDYIAFADAMENNNIGAIMNKLFPQLYGSKLKAFWHYHHLSALEVLTKVKWLLDGCKEVSDILQGCNVPLDDLENAASKAVNWQHPHIMMVAFCVEKFHLHSYDEGEKTKIADYLMEKQKESNSAMYQRKLSKLHQEKIKQNGK